jgi:diacylglycerol kinase (ATP)
MSSSTKEPFEREFTFVVNPAAGKGSSRDAILSLERLLPAFGHKYTLVRTEGTGHATEIARNASTSCVVAVGGDGTINEVCNGLVGTDKNLGVVPTGSGNDFVKSVRISKDLGRALDVLRSGELRRIDTGRLACGRLSGGSMVYAPARQFINGVGIGFDGQVAWRVANSKFFRGTMAYFAAVFETLGAYNAPEFQVSIDGTGFSGRKLLIATGNGKCAGGGFYLTPEAVVDDGYLDVCMIDIIPVIRILPLIPAVMSGKRVSNKAVAYMRAKSIRVESLENFWVHADGEVVGQGVEGVEMEVVPNSITLIGPSPNVK